MPLGNCIEHLVSSTMFGWGRNRGSLSTFLISGRTPQEPGASADLKVLSRS
jgi:hypothetical protein